MWRRTLDAWGYSPLDKINRSNVGGLKLAWSIDLDDAPSRKERRSFTTEFCIFRTRLTTRWPSTRPPDKSCGSTAGALPEDLGKFVPFPQTNRNLAIYDRLIIDNGADDTIYALDAVTGKLVWENRVFDYHQYHVKLGEEAARR